MEKYMKIVKEGKIVRLPPGFRFQPTDEELVFQYLKSKVLLWPLPNASIIPHLFNLFMSDPWDLPGIDMEQERYYFSNKEAKYPNGKRMNRATASGHWKATGTDKKIVSPIKNHNNHNIVGMKKTLVFYRGKPPHDSKTDWVMHEYRLVSVANHPISPTSLPPPTQGSLNQLEKWVLCRIYLKKSRSTGNTDNGIIRTCKNDKANYINEVKKRPRFLDFMTREEVVLDAVSSCSSSSSNCSSITEVSSSEEDYEESSN